MLFKQARRRPENARHLPALHALGLHDKEALENLLIAGADSNPPLYQYVTGWAVLLGEGNWMAGIWPFWRSQSASRILSFFTNLKG